MADPVEPFGFEHVSGRPVTPLLEHERDRMGQSRQRSKKADHCPANEIQYPHNEPGPLGMGKHGSFGRNGPMLCLYLANTLKLYLP
jgi:hypothetical protein